LRRWLVCVAGLRNYFRWDGGVLKRGPLVTECEKS